MRDLILMVLFVLCFTAGNITSYYISRNEMRKLPQKEVILAYKDKNDIDLYLQFFMPSEAGLTVEDRKLKIRYKSYSKELANGVYSYKILRIR